MISSNRFQDYDDASSEEPLNDDEEEEEVEVENRPLIPSYPSRSDQIGQVYFQEPTSLVKQSNMIIANSADRDLLSEELFHFKVSFNDSLEKKCKFHKTHIKNITKLSVEYIVFPKYTLWNTRYHGTNEIPLHKPSIVYVLIDEVKSSTEYSNDELQNVYQIFAEKRCCTDHTTHLFLPLNENDSFQGPVNYLSNGFTVRIKGIDDYCYNFSTGSPFRDRFHVSKLLLYETVSILRLFPSEEIPTVCLKIGDIVSFHNIEINTGLLDQMDPMIQNLFQNLIKSTLDQTKRKGYVVVNRGLIGGESYIDVSIATSAFPIPTLTLSNIDSLSYFKFPLNNSPFPKNFILNRSSQYEIGFKIEHLVPSMKYV